MSSEQVESMGVAAAVQELTRLEQHAAQARKVLVVVGDARPKLLAQLREALVPIGIDCVEVAPQGQQEYFDALPESERVSIQSFAQLLASPELAPLMNDPPPVLVREEAEPLYVAQEADPGPVPVADPVPAPAPAPAAKPAKLDMAKPINWKKGDIFTERFELPHYRLEWALASFDVHDKATLTGIDIEIEQVGGDHAPATSLMTIEQFMRSYVFVRRPETPAEEPGNTH